MTPFKTHEALDHPRIAHGFFGRVGGVSKGQYSSLNTGRGSGDNPDNVTENRRRVARALGTSEPQLQSLSQIHSRDVLIIDSPTREQPKADGLVTKTPGLGISALSADCAPVLFADTKAGVIGSAHAGWRGALSGVTDAVIDAMESVGATRKDIHAVIGPCIHIDHYQVGPDFRDAFIKDDSDNSRYFDPGPTRDDGSESYYFSLLGYLTTRLSNAGVERIGWSMDCTYALPEQYFSYRYNTHNGISDYGRNISAIMLHE
ncbi:peptidoglycan editing factor PgeF [Fretibacter rubidus]|uniref:peptidoglycan editing factor PgeF n=1 Tax=Fretibacter rubidus TaxID=570162 RepID=UPI00352AC794